MNANELADLLEDDYWDSRANKVMLEGAKMLRQQQVEIEALKKQIDVQNLEQFMKHEQEKEMNDKPVAYIDPYDLERLPHYDCHIGSQQLKNGIPLYTHLPLRELTDEKIRHIQAQCHLKDVGYDNFIMRFARAILRKASEK